MTDNMTLDGPANDLEALLPWYLSGKVTADEHAAIEGWLAEDADARQLLDAMREERAVTDQVIADIVVPDADTGLAKLMGMIEAEQSTRAAPVARASVAKPGLFERLANWMPTPGLRLAAGAAGVLLVIQAAAIAVMLTGGPGEGVDPSQPGFQTASGGDATPGAGPRFVMTFESETTIGDLADFLSAQNLVIVDGPRGGMYTVELTEAGQDESAVDALAVSLQNDPRVQFVGRAN